MTLDHFLFNAQMACMAAACFIAAIAVLFSI